MNCKKCGFQLSENDQFCKNCGATVNAQPEQIGVQPELVSVQPEQVNIQPEQVSVQPQQINVQPEQVSVQPEQVSVQQEQVSVQPEQVSVQPQPMSSSQPMNNMQQNYSNNNQNSWQNGYNPTPSVQQPKSNGNGKYIIIGIIVVVVIFAAIFGIIMLGNNDESNNSGGTSTGGNESANPSNNSTYAVKFRNFTFKIPTDLIYETDSDALYLGDEDGTWQAAIEVISGSFSQLQTNKNQLISSYQMSGYGAANVNQNTYGGLDFITIELSYSGQNLILGFTKANSMYVFGVNLYDLDNEFNYTLLPDIASILSTANYSENTNNISGFNKVDMGLVDELIK